MGSGMCEECRSFFHSLPVDQGCEGCQKVDPLQQIVKNNDTTIWYCKDCLQWKKQYPEYPFCHRAFFKYDEPFQQWLKQYKFIGDIRLAKSFVGEWQQLKKMYPDFIYCPIPLSAERISERGFNQVSEMLIAADLPFQELLVRKKHLPAQSKKTREQRLSMPQPFEFTNQSIDVTNQKILLIDDVYTTGQTIFHGASCLIRNAPQEIQSFSLAR
ncbi:MAG: ComF family protein [Enterococcus sp.]